MTHEGENMDSHNIHMLIDTINKNLMELDAAISFSAQTDTTDAIAENVVALHSVKADVAIVYESACAVLINSMGDIPEITLSSGIKIEKRSGADRKTWKHEEIARNVASRLSDMAIDMETGEVVLSPQEMAVKMLDYCNPSYWRVKDLAKIGINADRFCEISEGKTNIIVRKGTK